uniref:Secreted protein n=1 Tax=Octopus bimaculoides TaxID=37653 RepID=A0A0L8IE15_OCTBM
MYVCVCEIMCMCASMCLCVCVCVCSVLLGFCNSALSSTLPSVCMSVCLCICVSVCLCDCETVWFCALWRSPLRHYVQFVLVRQFQCLRKNCCHYPFQLYFRWDSTHSNPRWTSTQLIEKKHPISFS